MKKVKITVLAIHFFPELADEYLTEGREVGPCPLLNASDEFVYEGAAKMPEGLCPWAWITLYRSVSVLSAGGSYTPWNNQDGQTIECCTDGIRPVIFKLEAIGEVDPEVE